MDSGRFVPFYSQQMPVTFKNVDFFTWRSILVIQPMRLSKGPDLQSEARTRHWAVEASVSKIVASSPEIPGTSPNYQSRAVGEWRGT